MPDMQEALKRVNLEELRPRMKSQACYQKNFLAHAQQNYGLCY